MAKRKKDPAPVPPARSRTARIAVADYIKDTDATAREISMTVGVSEKQVYEHLGHIRQSLKKKEGAIFRMTPAECRSCGFVFAKRERLTRPGRCPICRSVAIEAPVFGIVSGE